MVTVASEMERQGFDIPLLIGGATTSRVHTAVKIDPSYRRGQTVYVTDASRAVGVASSLLSKDGGAGYAAIKRVGASEVKGVGVMPLAIGFLGLAALLGSVSAAWLFEGRRTATRI